MKMYFTTMRHNLTSIAVLCGVFIIGSGSAHAQQNFEQLSLPVGSVFELLIDTEVKQPTVEWVLTKEKEFLQAGRDAVFRTRFTENGNYILIGEVKNTDGSSAHKKIFYIRIRQRTAADDALNVDPNKLVAETVPTLDVTDRVIFAPNQQVLKITPNPNETDGIILDMNPEIDSNNDGNPRNDNSARDTFFSTKSTPIHLWMTQPIEKKEISIGSMSQAGKYEMISLRSKAQALEEDRIAEKEQHENKEVVTTDFGNGTIGFGLEIPEIDTESLPLLFHWNFGDGMQSLLDKPIHKYARGGDFNVSVVVRNLMTGEEMKKFVTIARVTIAAPQQTPTTPSDPSEQQSSNSSENPTEEIQPDGQPIPTDPVTEPEQEPEKPLPSKEPASSKKDLSLLWSIFTVVSVAVLSVLVGFGGVVLFNFLKKKGGVQSLLHKAEDTLMKPKEEGGLADVNAPPPMVLPDIEDNNSIVNGTIVDNPTFSDIETDESRNSTPSWMQPTEVEEVETAAAPSWLQSGIEKAKEIGQTQNAPPPPSLTESPPLQTKTTSSTEENLPSWLQGSNNQSASNATEPLPVPNPETVIEEPPVPSPEPPVPSPEPSVVAEAPSWLQTGMKQAEAKGQTMNTPPPAELADTSSADVNIPTDTVHESPAETPSWLMQDEFPSAKKTQTETPRTEPDTNSGGSTPSWLQQDTSENDKEEVNPPTPSWLHQDGAVKNVDQAPIQKEPVEDAPAPSWLTQDASDINTEQPTVPELSETQVTPDTEISDAPIPSWLQQDTSTINAVESTESSSDISIDTSIQPPQAQQDNSDETEKEPIPVSSTNSDENEDEDDHPIPPEEWEAMSPEDKEKARKRLKRRRYRENKKKQKNGNKSSEISDDTKKVTQNTNSESKPVVVADSAGSTEPTPVKQAEPAPVTEAEPTSNPDTTDAPQQPYWLEESQPVEQNTMAVDKAVPSWLQGGINESDEEQVEDSLPPATLEESATADDEEIKFMIRADSVNEQTEEQAGTAGAQDNTQN